MAFWALGGGEGTNEADKSLSKKQGINLQLPIAKLKDDKGQDKLSFYNKAQKDSLAFKMQLRMTLITESISPKMKRT